MNDSITQIYSKSTNCVTEKGTEGTAKENDATKSSKLAWKSISRTPETPPITTTSKIATTTSQETSPIAIPTSTGVKKVTFSNPEVSSVQLPSESQGPHEDRTPLRSRKSTPKKKRDRHHAEDEVNGQIDAEGKGHKVKRRKTKEVNSVEDGIKGSLKNRSISGETYKSL